MMRSLMLFFCLLAAVVCAAQELRTLRGKVVDAKGNGLMAVVSSGRVSVSTDVEGGFSIDVPPGAKLEITAAGYNTATVTATQLGAPVQLTEQEFINLCTLVLDPAIFRKEMFAGQYDIANRPIGSSQDILPLVPGLFIGQHAGGGKAEQLFLRGFDIDHGTDVNVSVDGTPVNMVSHAHGQGYADLHFVIPEMVQQVEFGKGPYQADRGNFATAGYVELRTRKTLQSDFVKVEGGQFGTVRVLGGLDLLRKKNNEGGSWLIAPEFMYTKGYFDSPQNFNRFNFFTKYTARLGASALSVTGSAFSSKWKASGQIPERAFQSGMIGFFGAIDPNEGGNTSRYQVNAQLTTKMGEKGSLYQQLYLARYEFELYSNFTFFLNNPVDGDQIRQYEKRGLGGYQLRYVHQGAIGGRRLMTTAGAGVRSDFTKGSELSRTRDRDILLEPVMKGDISELNGYAWLNNRTSLGSKWTVEAGLRYDQFRSAYKDELAGGLKDKAGAGIVSPKLNVRYDLGLASQVYILLGRGFHSNDTRVVVQQNGRDILPAAYGADLGYVYRPNARLTAQAALWYLKLDQEFVYVGDEGVVEPGGRTKRMGADILLRYQPFTWMSLDMDANYSHGRSVDDPKGSDRLPLAPVFTAIGGLSLLSKSGWSGSLRYRYMGDRPANADNTVEARGYFITDMVANYAQKKWQVTLTVQNLFDVRWRETQFDTESKLVNETDPVSEIHFTPGTPFFAKLGVTIFF